MVKQFSDLDSSDFEKWIKENNLKPAEEPIPIYIPKKEQHQSSQKSQQHALQGQKLSVNLKTESVSSINSISKDLTPQQSSINNQNLFRNTQPNIYTNEQEVTRKISSSAIFQNQQDDLHQNRQELTPQSQQTTKMQSSTLSDQKKQLPPKLLIQVPLQQQHQEQQMYQYQHHNHNHSSSLIQRPPTNPQIQTFSHQHNNQTNNQGNSSNPHNYSSSSNASVLCPQCQSCSNTNGVHITQNLPSLIYLDQSQNSQPKAPAFYQSNEKLISQKNNSKEEFFDYQYLAVHEEKKKEQNILHTQLQQLSESKQKQQQNNLQFHSSIFDGDEIDQQINKTINEQQNKFKQQAGGELLQKLMDNLLLSLGIKVREKVMQSLPAIIKKEFDLELEQSLKTYSNQFSQNNSLSLSPKDSENVSNQQPILQQPQKNQSPISNNQLTVSQEHVNQPPLLNQKVQKTILKGEQNQLFSKSNSHSPRNSLIINEESQIMSHEPQKNTIKGDNHTDVSPSTQSDHKNSASLALPLSNNASNQNSQPQANSNSSSNQSKNSSHQTSSFGKAASHLIEDPNKAVDFELSKAIQKQLEGKKACGVNPNQKPVSGNTSSAKESATTVPQSKESFSSHLQHSVHHQSQSNVHTTHQQSVPSQILVTPSGTQQRKSLASHPATVGQIFIQQPQEDVTPEGKNSKDSQDHESKEINNNHSNRSSLSNGCLSPSNLEFQQFTKQNQKAVIYQNEQLSHSIDQQSSQVIEDESIKGKQDHIQQHQLQGDQPQQKLRQKIDFQSDTNKKK